MNCMYHVGYYKVCEDFDYKAGKVILNITDERDNQFVQLRVTNEALADVRKYLSQHKHRKRGDLAKLA